MGNEVEKNNNHSSAARGDRDNPRCAFPVIRTHFLRLPPPAIIPGSCLPSLYLQSTPPPKDSSPCPTPTVQAKIKSTFQFNILFSAAISSTTPSTLLSLSAPAAVCFFSDILRLPDQKTHNSVYSTDRISKSVLFILTQLSD